MPIINILNKTSIQSLTIADVKDGDNLAKELAKVLPMTAIKRLKLQSCRISDEGALALAGMWKPLSTTDKVAKWLTWGAKESGVEHLDLEYNRIGRLGALALKKAFCENACKSLVLRSNAIDRDTRKLLRASSAPKCTILVDDEPEPNPLILGFLFYLIGSGISQ